jgi:hypothetical protein
MRRIDLLEEAGRLEHDELFAVRGGLRLLLCKPDVPRNVRELATLMLIFLDKGNMMIKRVHRGPSR